MSFEYNFEYLNDKVYFAYSEPYTFSDLMELIQQIKAEDYVKCETLCKSIGGIDVPLLTITQSNEITPKESFVDEVIENECLDSEFITELKKEIKQKFSKKHKKVLIVTARIHAGETCGSYVIQGFLKFITSNHPVAKELRGKLIIKVVPMMNIDGVIIGNYRCCISGQDLNRQFTNPNAKLHPTVFYIKKLIADIKESNKEIFGYIDLHGHSKKKCSFMYGPYYPLHMARYIRVRILAKLLSRKTQMFRYPACRFKQEPSKVNTARLVISREFDVMNSLTLESSFYGFLSEDRKIIEYCSKLYEKLGEHLGEALLEYLRLLDEEIILKLKRVIENRRRKRVIMKRKEQLKKDRLNIVRLEDCCTNAEAYTDIVQTEPIKIKEVFQSIKEDMLDSSSDSSESFIKEDTDAIQNIITVLQKFPIETNKEYISNVRRVNVFNRSYYQHRKDSVKYLAEQMISKNRKRRYIAELGPYQLENKNPLIIPKIAHFPSHNSLCVRPKTSSAKMRSYNVKSKQSSCLNGSHMSFDITNTRKNSLSNSDYLFHRIYRKFNFHLTDGRFFIKPQQKIKKAFRRAKHINNSVKNSTSNLKATSQKNGELVNFKKRNSIFIKCNKKVSKR